MRPFNTSRGGRRGNVTIIVVAFLALFLVLALTFVFYSIGEADQTKVYRDAANGGQTGVFPPTHEGAPPEPGSIFNTVLRDVIYGPPDGLPGAFDSFRGHDLARLIYGWNPNFDPLDPTTWATQPFNGYGRVMPQTIYPALPVQAATMIHYKWQPTTPGLGGLMYEIDNSYARNPKLNLPAFNAATYRYYAKNANYTYPDENNLFLAALDPTTGSVLLPSYHRYWMVVNSLTGLPELPPDNPLAGPIFVPPNPDTDPTNLANPIPWTNPFGKLVMLTPRPVDNQWPPGSGQSFFPYPTKNLMPNGMPDGTYGHVENIEGKPGGRQYDALWMDFDSPVRKWQGKNYKALVALTIVDLDSRINVNTAGNFFPLPDALQPPAAPPAIRQQFPPQYGHYSNQGVGGWEVNLARVMPDLTSANPSWRSNDAANLTRPQLAWKVAGDPPGLPDWKLAPPAVHNRYGGDVSGVPNRRMRTFSNENFFLNQPSPGSAAPYYGQVDFNGYNRNVMPDLYSNPGLLHIGHTTNLVFGQPFAAVAPFAPDQNSRYDNGLYIPAAGYDERTAHPSMYDPYWVKSRRLSNPGSTDRTFGVEEMRFLNEKFNYGKSDGSDLALLAPKTLGYPGAYPGGVLNPRFAITTLSSDLNQPGASPWLGAPAGYVLNGAYPTGFPQPLTPTSPGLPGPLGNADHDLSYRARLVAALGPVDLNRKLTDYRGVTNLPLSPTNVGNAQRARQDRQDLAQDIFNRLRAVTTGAVPPGPGQPMPAIPASGGPLDATYNALRWLAQLAVNIVDHIDNDDISTAFNWNGNDWVYGFERPRLVMNETYVRFENAKGDMGVVDPVNPPNKKTTIDKYSLRAWLELHNALTPGSAGEQNFDPTGDAVKPPTNPNDPNHGGFRTNLVETVAGVPQSAYRLLIYQVKLNPAPQMGMSDPDNVTGLPKPLPGQPAGWPKVVDFAKSSKDRAGKTIYPNVQALYGNGPEKSFYLIGPDEDAPAPGQDAQLPDGTYTADLTHPMLNIDLDKTTDVDVNTNRPKWVPMFVLQRLANPYIQGPPAALVPVSDPTNPYITIDYLDPDPTGKSVYDHVAFRFDGQRGPASTLVPPDLQQPDLAETYAWGRRQPYDARIKWLDPNAAKYYRQQPQPAAGMGKVNHTFGRHNGKPVTWPGSAVPGGYTGGFDQSPGDPPGGLQNPDTLQVPFLPLNHMDRILLSPAELLHVTAVKPHELTHFFYMAQTDVADPTKRRLAYTANWLDGPDAANLPPPGKSTFLFRALDFLRAGSFTEGLPLGGRVPGKVNPNTMFANLGAGAAADQFSAVADPSQANRFDQPQVDAAWQSFVGNTGRHPSPGQISANDRPVRGLAIDVSAAGLNGGVYGGTTGANSQDRTLARIGGLWSAVSRDEDFNPAGSAGAVQKYELLSKTLGQFTPRSNTFAVYATIGYFEVVNEGPYDESNRPILGKELGTDEGTTTRHKFFAAIDRTNLTLEMAAAGPTGKQAAPPIYFDYQPDVPLPNGIGPTGFTVIADPDLFPTNRVPPVPSVPSVPRVDCRIPAQSQLLGLPPTYPNPPGKTVRLYGYYDGTPWTMADDSPANNAPLSIVVLDIGPKQELCVVRFSPNQPAFDPNTGTATITLEPLNPTGFFLYRHSRGVPIRLVNPDLSQSGFAALGGNPANLIPTVMPGNPGPQAGFQFRSNRYAPVVRYAEQTQ